MIVDSSALSEQVVVDVVQSSFDSAGQRCSALRILCLQDDVADRVLGMLKGALHELSLGNPDRLSTDVGPVIDVEARDGINRHIDGMRGRGFRVEQLPMPAECAHGTFVPPTLIEITRVSDVEREVFGPVLHVLRFARNRLDALIDDINGTGYGLTFGVHSRIDETIERMIEEIDVGNLYVNRNVIGAVVGVQPFGGEGLSGTGPKAGGPLYLKRLLSSCPATIPVELARDDEDCTLAKAYAGWLRTAGHDDAARRCEAMCDASPLRATASLPGPTGERNTYALEPRGPVLCLAQTSLGMQMQLAAALVTGNQALFIDNPHTGQAARDMIGALPAELGRHAITVPDTSIDSQAKLGGVLYEGEDDGLLKLSQRLAQRAGPIILAQGLRVDELAQGREYDLERLLAERSVSVNTAAAGGNASLMAIG